MVCFALFVLPLCLACDLQYRSKRTQSAEAADLLRGSQSALVCIELNLHFILVLA